MNIKTLFCCIVLSIGSIHLSGQVPPEKLVKIAIAPDHANWLYKPREHVRFSISVSQFNIPVKNIQVQLEVGQERITPSINKAVTLPDGAYTIDGGTLKEAGFLRCIVTAEVNGTKYRNLATAGFTPENIKPVAELPADFIQFWNQGKKELADFAMDNKMTLLPEKCTQNVNVYHVNLQGYGRGSRIYGILCVPVKPGKYPALLKVPGAGVRPYGGDIALAEKGIITLEIGIHGIPVTMDPGVYTSLAGGALNNYQNFNLDDKNKFYYKRVYLNCVQGKRIII